MFKKLWENFKNVNFLLPGEWTNPFLLVGLTIGGFLFFLTLINIIFWNGQLTNTFHPEFGYADLKNMFTRIIPF